MACGIRCKHCGGYEAEHYDETRDDLDKVYPSYTHSLNSCPEYTPMRELTDEEKEELRFYGRRI